MLLADTSRNAAIMSSNLLLRIGGPRLQDCTQHGPAEQTSSAQEAYPSQGSHSHFIEKGCQVKYEHFNLLQKVETENTLFYGTDTTGFPDTDEPSGINDDNFAEDESKAEPESPTKPAKRRKLSNVEYSDAPTEDDDEPALPPKRTSPPLRSPKLEDRLVPDADAALGRDAEADEKPILPGLFKELGVARELDNLEDVGDEFLGEEYREMMFSREQERLEAEEAGLEALDDFLPTGHPDDSMIEACPICNGSLIGASPEESTRHVNSCLDGNPTPLPNQDELCAQPEPEQPTLQGPHDSGSRSLKAAIPRPGQRNPFSLAVESEKSTAFSKLMSGNAENSAWAAAAAEHVASRGKQAYQRTCPFYKIMPGFSICVDAFRYGAVKDCNAYFLSHFHSDHYVGLTGSWRHGPIYCSRVTGRLVKQRLKVDEKWVVELEFDEVFEIPGTDGATVVMIPANHCPGSSMFLFEKKMPNGRSGGRIQRILHCGDFRACPAHVNHDRLKPDILDYVSGKIKQQRIDICYLDTTYLSPRYSFPPQGDVISACADICSSLNMAADDSDEAWGKLAREAGATTVSRFFSDSSKKVGGDAVQEYKPHRVRLLVVCGTYSIGKERICVAIAKALNSKIYASASKIQMFKLLDDPELSSLLTSNPLEAQVHMQMLMEIRAETLQEYLNGYKPHFDRIVGFRPSGWNYRPVGASKLISSNTQPGAVATTQVLHSKAWRSRFSANNLEKQRGSTKESMCFGVPYSEHSSFRELAMFLMSLRIERVIPTVNVGSETSRRKMKGWIDKWLSDRAKGGLVKPRIEDSGSDSGSIEEWDGKGTRREVYW
ncbi:unnamed protein product [Parascedosporium putredinis]|uniref:DRMBL-domain-containing protein n=1 Tax=Parascedosporium putredinis TaxID=1442378 RepID=A0A9P1H672_9PEZI|nr:unnamed protein product [Parascedosporium putredinis]CAI7997756.1 unnamed protein product [Parascedosporium putredinis]